MNSTVSIVEKFDELFLEDLSDRGSKVFFTKDIDAINDWMNINYKRTLRVMIDAFYWIRDENIGEKYDINEYRKFLLSLVRHEEQYIGYNKSSTIAVIESYDFETIKYFIDNFGLDKITNADLRELPHNWIGGFFNTIKRGRFIGILGYVLKNDLIDMNNDLAVKFAIAEFYNKDHKAMLRLILDKMDDKTCLEFIRKYLDTRCGVFSDIITDTISERIK